METRARARLSDFETDEAPTKPHLTPLEGRLGPDVPGPPRPPSQKIRKIVVRKVPSGTMPAAKPLPPPDSRPKPIVGSPIVMVSGPSIATPTRGGARPRWWPRIALLVVVVGAELTYAERTGALELPQEVGQARAMLKAVAVSSQ